MPDVKKVLKTDARTGWETTGKGIFFVVFIQEMGELFGGFDVKLGINQDKFYKFELDNKEDKNRGAEGKGKKEERVWIR